MVIKLWKHELRATARVMLPLCGGVLLAGVTARLAGALLTRPGLPESLGLLLGLVYVLFFLGLAALYFAPLVLMVLRFRTNLLGDEGYLMMMLPASVHSHLWAKLLTALVWAVAAALTAGVAGLLWASGAVPVLRLAGQFFSALAEETIPGVRGAELMSLTWQLPLLSLLGGTAALLRFYAAVSTGYGFAKHPFAISVLAYLIVGAVMDYITTSFTGLGLHLLAVGANFVPAWNLTVALTAASLLLSAGIYYVITVMNLKYRLNLG